MSIDGVVYLDLVGLSVVGQTNPVHAGRGVQRKALDVEGHTAAA